MVIPESSDIMQSAVELHKYRIKYATVSQSGVIGLANTELTIESKNQEEAIDCIRTKALAAGHSGIRVSRIEKLSKPPVQNLKKKKTIWGWVFSFLFVAAMLAKLLPILFS